MEQSEHVAEPVLGDEDPPFRDDPVDLGYQLQSQRYTYLTHLTPCRQKVENSVSSDLLFSSSGVEEEGLSTDEDLPFRDDLNDQSYDPKDERCVFVCV